MSHQDRRDPLPADYQYPTHGVDCDCPPCRDKQFAVINAMYVETVTFNEWLMSRSSTQTAYGWGV